MKKTKNISGQAPGGHRTKLAGILPLYTPMLVQIFPIYACNFKCDYCVFHLDKKERGFISDKIVMDLSLYRKAVEELTLFPGRIKVLRLVGVGEPLLHPDIVEMVRYAASRNVADKVEILTNAFLLKPELSNALIAAGLSRLVVSLQGTSKEKYWETSRIKLDFDVFVKDLKYFNDHKGGTQMYVKIVDSALDGVDDEKRFFEIFSGVCDNLAVEHIVPIHDGIDYEKVMKGKNISQTQFGLPVSELKICPQPFFHMQLNPDGKVVPCYSWDYPAIVGDCNKQSMFEIWNSKKFRNFRRQMLEGRKNVCRVCAECRISQYRMFPEDMISDDDAERLKKLF